MTAGGPDHGDRLLRDLKAGCFAVTVKGLKQVVAGSFRKTGIIIDLFRFADLVAELLRTEPYEILFVDLQI